MIKIDLHTHSEASPDGGINFDQYQKALNKKLDCIAITDHNRIDFAIYAQKKLGNKIIIGEEIMTRSGEVIGLFLSKKITPFQSIGNTIKQIKDQGGLVYIPHPFEKIRSGVSEINLNQHIDNIDIIETINGRALLGRKTKKAVHFARQNNIVGASSSDSHGHLGWGRTFTIIDRLPTSKNLVVQLSGGKHIYKKPSLGAILYPKYNTIKKALS